MKKMRVEVDALHRQMRNQIAVASRILTAPTSAPGRVILRLLLLSDAWKHFAH